MVVKKKKILTVLIFFCLAIILSILWIAYKHYYSIPQGPKLPEEPPEKEYSKQVIELNNKAASMQLEDPDKALLLYDQAIELDREYHMAYVNKATIFIERKNYVEANECFQVLISMQPRVAEYYTGYGFCLHRLGQEKEAENQLYNALSAYNYRIKSDPTDYFTKLSRAMILFILGKESIAKRELTEIEKANCEISEFIPFILEEMDEVEDSDPWLILGIDN